MTSARHSESSEVTQLKSNFPSLEKHALRHTSKCHVCFLVFKFDSTFVSNLLECITEGFRCGAQVTWNTNLMLSLIIEHFLSLYKKSSMNIFENISFLLHVIQVWSNVIKQFSLACELLMLLCNSNYQEIVVVIV